jgi:phosphomannomutase
MPKGPPEGVISLTDKNVSLGELAAAAGAGFGTSGVRARVADLTPALCSAYTEAFLAVAEPRGGRLLIGHDLRPSSPSIAAVCYAAARDLGFDVLYAGVLPTPALAFAAQSLGMPAIMVTGSHIPFDRNGLKFYHAHGEITKADEQRILAMPVAGRAAVSTGELPVPDPHPLNLYLRRYLDTFAPDALAGLRIGVYEHSSAARETLHHLLRALGADTVSLGRSDDFVAIDTEAVRPDDYEIGPIWARQHGLDAIVTTDGDADRPLLADENGAWLRGDVLGMICARELSARTVVTPVTSNSGLEACGLFPSVQRTRVGSPYVIAAMEAATDGPVVGYEANGGLLLGSEAALAHGALAPLKTRDAVLPVLLALSAMRRTASPLSGLRNGLGGRHTFSDRLQGIDVGRCRHLLERAAADPQSVVMELLGAAAGPVTIDRTDGVRFRFESGDIIHLRLSGNAPELRCYTDAASAERAEQLCRNCLERLRPQL